jgi:diguanylate cyclase (GGDEF)-like protein
MQHFYRLLFVYGSLITATQGWAAPFEKTDEQIAYLNERESITMCVDPDWMPYEKIDANGQHIGIAADYMTMFSEKIGKSVQLIPTRSWSESEAFAEQRRCDILSLLNYSEPRAQYLNFTEPYLEASVVLVARDSVPFIDGMSNLAGQTLAIVKDYVYEDVIRSQFPDIELVYVQSMDEALRLVSDGDVFTTMASLYIVTSQIAELGLNNLKIAGSTGFSNQLRVGVRNDDPVLLSLFQTAVENIDPSEENEILRNWISVRLETGTDYGLIIRLMLVAFIIIVLLLYRQWSVNKLVIQLNHLNQQLEIKSEALSRLSRTDSLTKLHNRLYLDEHLSEEQERFGRYGSLFCVIMLDVDNFKEINDLHGHAIGDEALKIIADDLKQSVRRNDIVGRWGGEEFLIICPQTSLEGAIKLANSLREKIEMIGSTHAAAFTCSFGVAEIKQDERQDRLLARADEALYRAKALGRNRVCNATSEL